MSKLPGSLRSPIVLSSSPPSKPPSSPPHSSKLLSSARPSTPSEPIGSYGCLPCRLVFVSLAEACSHLDADPASHGIDISPEARAGLSNADYWAIIRAHVTVLEVMADDRAMLKKARDYARIRRGAMPSPQSEHTHSQHKHKLSFPIHTVDKRVKVTQNDVYNQQCAPPEAPKEPLQFRVTIYGPTWAAGVTIRVNVPAMVTTIEEMVGVIERAYRDSGHGEVLSIRKLARIRWKMDIRPFEGAGLSGAVSQDRDVRRMMSGGQGWARKMEIGTTV